MSEEPGSGAYDVARALDGPVVKRLLPTLTRGRLFLVCGRVFPVPKEHRAMYRRLYRNERITR